VYRSEDGGASWTARLRYSETGGLGRYLLSNVLLGLDEECLGEDYGGYGQGWYDNTIAVDPMDPDIVWAGGIDLFRSDDGGATWKLAAWAFEGIGQTYVHADKHTLLFPPGYDGAANQQLLMGPWGHAVNTTSKLGEVDFGSHALIDLDGYWVRWLKAQLDDEPWPDPPVRTFVMGTNEWRDDDVWPPAGMTPTPLFLRSGGPANSRLGDGRLTWEEPAADEPSDSYDYSPERPFPFITGITSAQLGGPDDYSAVELRGDCLVYTSDELTEPLQLIGPVRLVLHATSDAPDTDFMGKLLDVHPSGFAQRLCDGMVRARFRDGFDAERLLSPGESVEYDLDLWHTAHVFLPGHRVRVEIASAAFPKHPRNLNTDEPLATGTRMQTAHQTVHHTAARPSRVVLPVVPL